MNEPPESPDPESCARFLRELGASEARVLPIAEAALALASLERRRVDFARYRDHLRLIARDVGSHPGASGDLAGRAGALNEIILLKHGYSGDELTYDDVQNANLMRVIDRRKGLPVVLGILFIDAARAQGWGEVAGLAFPGASNSLLTSGARLTLVADDERLMRTHVEDRHHQLTADRVGLANRGDAVDAAAAGPQLDDPPLARGAAELAFELLAHRLVGVSRRAGLVGVTRNEECGQRRPV